MLQKSFLKLAASVLLLLCVTSNAWAGYLVPDTGDPNEQVCNPRRSFYDNRDGTITDILTGLQWQQLPNSTLKTAFNAGSYCDNLIFPVNGHSDWRLPTVQELATLVDHGRSNPAIDLTYFGMTSESKYWTADSPPPNAYPWYIDFSTGRVYKGDESNTNTLSVRAVRGPSYEPVNPFVDNGDGTVSDPDTGLMWQKSGSDSGRKNWSDAGVYIESLNAVSYFGYDDWRLPTRNELQSLLDYDSYNPATLFPGANTNKYWSSTTQSGTTSLAWYIDFQIGAVDTIAKTINTYSVRAVRSGPCFAECLTNEHCDDGVACNGEETCRVACDGEETCTPFTCVPGTPTCAVGAYCYVVDDACVECLINDHCDDGVVCNGVETCANEICVPGTSTCGLSYCNETIDDCVECLNNGHCANGVFCDGVELCTGNMCFDGPEPCTGEDEYCEEQGDGRCVECLDEGDCPDDDLYCTGPKTCEDGMCGFEETCPGEQCNETSQQCVECLTDDHCDDDIFCNGAEQCIGDACFFPWADPCIGDDYCDESLNACVECLIDDHCASGYACFWGICAPAGEMWIDKSKVKAGKTAGTDSMKLSGVLDAGEADLLAADEVVVSFTAGYIPDSGVIEYRFPVAAEFLKKGKYTSPKIKPVDKTDTVKSLVIDSKKGTFKFSVKNADLTGLSCPITCRVKIEDDVYIAEMIMVEGLVNGTKKPCPLPLLMGVYASLDAEKVKAKKSTKTASDSISISGTFTIDGEFDTTEPLIIALGSDEFTVPGTAFVEKKGSYSCKNYDTGDGFVTVKFDTVKCTYSIKIKSTTLSGSGNVDFEIDLFGNSLQASSQILLPPDP